MSLVGIRRALHHVYTVATLVLVATGLLLNDPDLRARLIGGYGRETLDVHLWAGWVFLGVPALALLVRGRPLLRDLVRRLGPPDGLTWRKFHTVLTLVAGVLLGVTGVVLWLDVRLPMLLADAILLTHEWCMWVVIAALAVHVVVAWRKTVSRTREILMGQPEPLFSFETDDDMEGGSP
jgi:cytochrome b subunit of formate dehydrogenase